MAMVVISRLQIIQGWLNLIVEWKGTAGECQ